MSAHPNNTPQQKHLWRLMQSPLVSRFERWIPSNLYHPEPKAPSRRDRHRYDVAIQKPELFV